MGTGYERRDSEEDIFARQARAAAGLQEFLEAGRNDPMHSSAAPKIAQMLGLTAFALRENVSEKSIQAAHAFLENLTQLEEKLTVIYRESGKKIRRRLVEQTNSTLYDIVKLQNITEQIHAIIALQNSKNIVIAFLSQLDNVIPLNRPEKVARGRAIQYFYVMIKELKK